MTDRIIEISESPARLRVSNRLLVIEAGGCTVDEIPLSDIAVLLVSHPQVTYTQAVLSGLAAVGASFVACDNRGLPVGHLLPLFGNYVQTERFAHQIAARKPVRKRLWQEIVRAKIQAQASVLRSLHDADDGLALLANRVRSGDPDNVEAQASRLYWTRLFSDTRFRRDPAAHDQNRYLNYGYAVLRGIVARATVAAGLHPSIGIHHHNRYNPYCLADDLMEPFRPLVDRTAAKIVAEWGPTLSMKPDVKQELIEPLLCRYNAGTEERTLFDLANRNASAALKRFKGEKGTFLWPLPGSTQE